MIKGTSFIFSLVFSGILLAGCANQKKTTGTTGIPTLKETFKNDFAIGTALNENQILEKDPGAAQLVPQQFNAVTPENIMKAEEIHPEWGRYNFELADKLVAYAKKHNMQVNAHTLIWHSQLPPFVRHMKDADSVRRFFTEHINTIASRYDGKVYSWDVVNEALEEDGTMRKSIFLEKLGDDFVTEAFRLAQKAAPNTKLYYNDYNIEEPAKRAGAIRLIKKIQAAGVRIDGVGIQGHWRAYNVPLADIEQSIKEFAALGIEVMFTELDLGVLQHPREVVGADVNQKAEYDAKMNPYAAGLPDSMQVKLSNSYEALFKLFLKYKDNISRVTFWGVNDAQSWLNDWPIPGRTNYPLLFDRLFKPKPAFYRVIATKSGGAADKAYKLSTNPAKQTK
jgi:endo-1,4-beta-xylanase